MIQASICVFYYSKNALLLIYKISVKNYKLVVLTILVILALIVQLWKYKEILGMVPLQLEHSQIILYTNNK